MFSCLRSLSPSSDATKEAAGDEKMSAEEVADAIAYFFGLRWDGGATVKPEVHTSAAPLQHLDAATRGHNHTAPEPNSTVLQ